MQKCYKIKEKLNLNKPSPSLGDKWQKYLKFSSYHELGKYDLKASIDFVLQETGQNDLTYYGYSMGTTMSYVLLSTFPEYNQKLKIVYSLAPVVFWKHKLRRLPKYYDVLSNQFEVFIWTWVHSSTNENSNLKSTKLFIFKSKIHP